MDRGSKAIGRAGQGVASSDKGDAIAHDRQRAVGDGTIGLAAGRHGGEAEIDPEMVPARSHGEVTTLPIMVFFPLNTRNEQTQLSFATP